MKANPIIPIVMVLLILLMRPDDDAFAFHDGGVGACDACHSMHNPSQLAGSSSLLRSSDPSSTCLNCHEQTGDTGPTRYHVSTSESDMPPGAPPKQLGPAGDFGWLKKTFRWFPSATGVLQVSPGDRHGHNIIANNFQYFADSTNTEAPMGNYPATSLTCISCHDPHGKYRRDSVGSIATSGTPIQGSGSYASSAGPQPGFSVGVYRLLGGKNYHPKYLSDTFAFTNDPPAAVSPDTYNRAESGTQTRVAYGSNMSEWCQNCHNTPKEHAIVSSGTSTVPHPVGSLAKFGSTLSTNYNIYIKTGVLTGNMLNSFLSLVPFEEGSSDYPTLKAHARSDDSYLYGPDSTSSQVMCLTCHRAHASAWDYATRWNTNSNYIVYNGYYSQDGQAYQPYGQGRTEMEAQKAYYDMQASRFALNQDTLCHKCHGGALP